MSRSNNIIDNCELVSAGEAKQLQSFVPTLITCCCHVLDGEEKQKFGPRWAELV